MPTTIDDLEQTLNAQQLVIQQLITTANALQTGLDSEKTERARSTPIGSIIAFAGQAVPERYLLCDGTACKSTDYPELFASIGTAHGNGSDAGFPGNDFNIPDYRGYFLRGVDASGTVDPDTLDRTPPRPGGNGRNAVGSVQMDQFIGHGHDVTDPGHAHGYNHLVITGGPPIAGGIGGAVFGDNRFTTAPSGTGITIVKNGGNETRPKNAYMYYIIKVK